MRGGQSGGQITTYLARSRVPPVLIMGNSRVALNIDPAIFPAGSANLAHYGTGQVFATGLLHILQQAHKLPPTLVLHLDLDEYAQPARPEEISQLSFYYRDNPYVAAQINALGWAERLKNQSALYCYNSRILSLAKAWLRPGTSTDFGFEPVPPDPQDSLRTVYSSQRLNVQAGRFNRAPLEALRKFVAVCRAEVTIASVAATGSPQGARICDLAVTSPGATSPIDYEPHDRSQAHQDYRRNLVDRTAIDRNAVDGRPELRP